MFANCKIEFFIEYRLNILETLHLSGWYLDGNKSRLLSRFENVSILVNDGACCNVNAMTEVINTQLTDLCHHHINLNQNYQQQQFVMMQLDIDVM